MATTFSTTLWRNTVVNALTGQATVSTNLLSGTIQIRSGTQPAAPSDAATGTLLTTFSTDSNTMSTASAGASQLAASVLSTAVATATATWARWISGGSGLLDGSVGVSGSGATFILDTLSINSGSPSQLTACSLRFPQGSGTFKFNVVARNKLIDMMTKTTSQSLDMGKGGTLSLYSGTQPSSPDSPATGTLLAQIPMGTSSVVCFAAASGGAAALTGSQSVNAVASGTIGYARWTKGTYVIDGSAGNAGTEDFVLDSASTTSGNSIALTNATITY